MKYVQRLIDLSRENTENKDFSETTGISTEELLGYVNRAQESMQSAISSAHADLFQTESILDVASQQEVVGIPDDAFLLNKLDNVEYTPTGNGRNYYKIKQGRLSERLSGNLFGSPSFYIRRSGTILLQPAPQGGGGKLRITYQKTLPKLDTRRGTVGSVVLGADTITSLTLDTTTLLDKTALEEEEYITVVDRDGLVKMRRIPVDEVNETSGVVTVAPGFTFEDGETIAVGDYVLRGKESTTHSPLPNACERFLIEYCDWRILKRDSSQDSIEESQELVAMKQEIIEAFSNPDADPDFVTVLDSSYMDHDNYY